MVALYLLVLEIKSFRDNLLTIPNVHLHARDVGNFTGYRYEDSSTYSTEVIRKFRIVYEHGVRPSQASRINEPDQETSRGPVAAVSNEYAPADRNCVVRDPVG